MHSRICSVGLGLRELLPLNIVMSIFKILSFVSATVLFSLADAGFDQGW